MSDTRLNASKRYSTRYPGTYYRLDSKGNRRYQISYTDSAGSRIFKTLPKGTTEKEAVRERNQILERMHRGEKVVQSRMVVRELIDDYLKTQTAHLRPKTYQAYEYSLDHYVLPFLGERRVSSLQTKDVAAFIADMRKRGYKAWTIRGCLSPMSRMFIYATRLGVMSTNPVRDLDRSERPKSDQKKMEILNSDEIEKLLNATEGTYRTLFATAIFTGMRISEILALDWDDVDLIDKTFRVHQSKTHAGVRVVVMPDFLMEMIAKLEGREGVVFKSKSGGELDQSNVRRALRLAIKKAKIKHVRFHDLRHTYASMMIGQGMDVDWVARQLGHAHGGFTLRIYAQVFDIEKKKLEARKRMQEFAYLVTPKAHPTSSTNGNGRTQEASQPTVVVDTRGDGKPEGSLASVLS